MRIFCGPLPSEYGTCKTATALAFRSKLQPALALPTPLSKGLGYRVSDVGLRVEGPGLMTKEFGFSLYGLGFRVQGIGFGVQDLESRVWGLGFRAKGLA